MGLMQLGMKQPAEISNDTFSSGSPTESLNEHRGTLNSRLPGIDVPRGVPSGAPNSSGQSQPQIAVAHPVLDEAESLTTQTTRFVEADSGEQLSFPESGTKGVYTPIAPSIELGKFLERPVLIQSYTWNSAWSDVTFYPWFNYLTKAEISYKLRSFPYIRGKLKLKFVINSSPFYYGAMRATYEPLNGFNTPRVSTFGGSSLIPRSQQPGIFIYPQTSTGGVMELPFFYHQDYIPLMYSSNLNNIGMVKMLQFAALKSANGATSNGCTISIYAWMEDVQLAGFTSNMILQGDTYVEDHTGPVSAPASLVSRAASYFENIPVIGKFAMATRIGSSAVAHIASLFGWSNTPVISSVKPVKNLPFHDLASAEISQPVSKFTLDPKGELSVSPYMVGLNGEDELTVASLVQRDSFLTSFTWNTTDSPDTLFFSSLVNPLLYDRGSPDASGTYAIQLTPLAWVARNFRYWRGDVVFTFRIISSPFHRGRLRIHWEPSSTPSTATDLSHVTMTEIVDIESTTEINFRVPYLQPVPWLEHTHQGDIYTNNRWSTSSVMTPSTGDDNGSLVVRCLNNLSAPVDTAPITVLVFVRGAENVQFANPIDGLNKLSYLVPQAGTEIIESNERDPSLFIKNWGEPVVSLRKLLRRAELVDIQPVNLEGYIASDKLREWRLPMSKYPAHPGYSVVSYDTARSVTGTGTVGFNYTNMTHFAWIAPAFLALRGSMRWHFNVINSAAHGPDSVALVRDPGVTISAPATVTLVDSAQTDPTHYKNSWWTKITTIGGGGIALTNYEGQPGLSCELPMMIPFKFYINRFAYWLTGNSLDKSNGDLYKLIVRTVDNVEGNDMAVERYCAIGTDFNAHFFLCVPTVYYNVNSGSFPSG